MSWWTEDGSTHLHACLPHADAAGLLKLIEGHLEEDRRATRHRRDVRTPEQRRANAFVALVAAHHDRQASPTIGGDRPRIVVHLDHDRLRQRAEGAGVLETGEPLAAGDLRRLCRDADISPPSSAPTPTCSTSATRPAWPRRPSAPPSTYATAAASSPTATCRPAAAKPTTSSPGGRAAPPTAPTWPFSAPHTTPSSNHAAPTGCRRGTNGTS